MCKNLKHLSYIELIMHVMNVRNTCNKNSEKERKREGAGRENVDNKITMINTFLYNTVLVNFSRWVPDFKSMAYNIRATWY